jgi:pyruvate dehydrogenase E2 component (dihydrolipoamide acetyltransferase)
MARSKREIPHYHLSRDIDLTTPLAWLEDHNAGRSAAERVLPAAVLLRAVALAAHDVPEVNGTYEDGAFRPAGHVDLGVAVSLRSGGIIAPSILAADTMTLDELMAALRERTGRARRGGLRQTDLAGATLTVTSLGDHGADLVHGVIFPPQVALVGFGRVDWRPWAAGDTLASRRTVVATLAGDHRVSDGHRGSLFLASVDHHLQQPDDL